MHPIFFSHRDRTDLDRFCCLSKWCNFCIACCVNFLLHKSIPLFAGRALSHPLRGLMSAFLTEKYCSTFFGHRHLHKDTSSYEEVSFVYFFMIFTATSPEPSNSTLMLSFPERFVFMTPALSPATITSYSQSSSVPTVICAS